MTLIHCTDVVLLKKVESSSGTQQTSISLGTVHSFARPSLRMSVNVLLLPLHSFLAYKGTTLWLIASWTGSVYLNSPTLLVDSPVLSSPLYQCTSPSLSVQPSLLIPSSSPAPSAVQQGSLLLPGVYNKSLALVGLIKHISPTNKIVSGNQAHLQTTTSDTCLLLVINVDDINSDDADKEVTEMVVCTQLLRGWVYKIHFKHLLAVNAWNVTKAVI